MHTLISHSKRSKNCFYKGYNNVSWPLIPRKHFVLPWGVMTLRLGNTALNCSFLGLWMDPARSFDAWVGPVCACAYTYGCMCSLVFLFYSLHPLWSTFPIGMSKYFCSVCIFKKTALILIIWTNVRVRIQLPIASCISPDFFFFLVELSAWALPKCTRQTVS